MNDLSSSFKKAMDYLAGDRLNAQNRMTPENDTFGINRFGYFHKLGASRLEKYVADAGMDIITRLSWGNDLELPELMVQELYEQFMKGNDSLEHIVALRRVSGINPSEASLQKLYQEAIFSNKIRVNYAIKLSECIGIKPKISEEKIQEAYEMVGFRLDYIKNGRNFHNCGSIDLDYVKGIMDLTGVGPSEELVQKAYIKLMRSTYNETITPEEIALLTGIQPNIPQETIEKISEEKARKNCEEVGEYDVGWIQYS